MDGEAIRTTHRGFRLLAATTPALRSIAFVAGRATCRCPSVHLFAVAVEWFGNLRRSYELGVMEEWQTERITLRVAQLARDKASGLTIALIHGVYRTC